MPTSESMPVKMPGESPSNVESPWLKKQQWLVTELNERKLPVEQLLKTLNDSKDVDEWMPKCVSICTDLVDNPVKFCGAFWHDKKQWYHGPVKTRPISKTSESSST